MSGKRRNSTIDQKWEDNYLDNGQLSTSRCIKTVIIFQQHFVYNIEIHWDQRISPIISEKVGLLSDPVTTRSGKHACGKPMPAVHDKQAMGNREPANEMNKDDPTQGIPVWLQPFTVTGGACARTFLWKSELRFGRWCFKSGDTKNGSTVFMLTSEKKTRDVFCERKSMVTWQQQSTKSSTNDVNLGTITDTLSWYKFSPLSGIRVKPKLHRRRRRIYDSSYSRRRSQKLFIRTNYLNLASIVKIITESSNNYTSSIRDKRNWRTSCTSSKRRDISSTVANLDRMISGGRIVWNAVAICERTKTSWQTGHLKMNEELENPSRTCFVRGGNLGRRYSDCWDWRIGKVGCIRTIFQKTECERSPDNPKRLRLCISYGRWFSKIIRKKLRNPKDPLWDGNPP